MWMLQRPVDSVSHALRVGLSEHTVFAPAVMLPRLLWHPVWREVRPRQGKGRGVLLIPGFGFGDRSLTMAQLWLRARNCRPEGARLGLNLGCTTMLLDRIERRLEEHAEATGGRVIVLGQSRGGWLGRLAAVRRPDLVRGLVMLGSPVLDPLGAHPNAVRIARTLARLSAFGIPGLLDDDCFAGHCYRTNSMRLSASLPAEVPAVTVYSRSDTIVPWHLCRDPDAECVEVRSSHTAMGLDPDFYAAIEPRLADWAGTDTT